MCLAKEFLKEEKKQQCCFTFIPKGSSVNGPTRDISTYVREVLPEFEGIMIDDMSTRFSVTRSISHKIDLIRRPSMPNKAPHSMTPIENVEINRHVQKLLDKTFIRQRLEGSKQI